MAFTFQINNHVEFNHDDRLLKKAQQLKPSLSYTTVHPQSLVELTNDSTKLNSVGTKKIGDISNLSTMKFKRNDKVILDFGSHYVGQFSINIQHTGSPQDAPLTLRLRFAEVPAELKFNSQDYDGWLSKSWIQEELLHIDQLPVDLKLPRRYAFRYVEITVVDTSPKWAALFINPEVIAESSADDSKNKPVQLTDPDLQAIYDVSVRTLHDCMQTVFEDGPKRDRRLWLGDLRLQALADYATFKNYDLVKRCLYLFGGTTAKDGRIVANVFTSGNPQPDDTFLLDYSLFFVSSLYDYYQETKDNETLRDLFPIAQKQVEYTKKHYVNENGVFQPDDDYPVFVDWSNEFDKTTAGVAILIYTFNQYSALAKIMGVNTDDIDKLISTMVKYSTTDLFDQGRGLFISGPDHEFNIASQVWMVLAGVVTSSEAQAVMTATKSQLFPVKGIATPYMYHHIAHAFFKAGLTKDGTKMLKDYWGKMISLGADTYWEAFEPEQPDYSPYGSPIVSSYCHAWGCTPAFLIKKYLMK